MADEHDRIMFESSPRSIRWLRIFWWVVMIAAPVAMPTVILWAGGPVSVAALAVAAAGGVMLLNGYRTVIGVGLWPDRMRLITPLSAREYRWEEVRTRHLMFELQIHVRGVLLPYTYASVWREGREAMATIRYYASQARST